MKIKFIVIHCSDTPNDRDVTAADIHRWHLEKKWSGIGYNEVIRRSGLVEHGRPPYWQGAHVRDFDGDGEGDNSDSIGICLIGRDQYTDDQFDSLTALIGQSIKLDVDKDGRTVMPIKQRQKLGLKDGELYFSGLGDHFEIWKAETYTEEVGDNMADWLEGQGDDFDPLSLLDG